MIAFSFVFNLHYRQACCIIASLSCFLMIVFFVFGSNILSCKILISLCFFCLCLNFIIEDLVLLVLCKNTVLVVLCKNSDSCMLCKNIDRCISYMPIWTVIADSMICLRLNVFILHFSNWSISMFSCPSVCFDVNLLYLWFSLKLEVFLFKNSL